MLKFVDPDVAPPVYAYPYSEDPPVWYIPIQSVLELPDGAVQLTVTFAPGVTDAGEALTEYCA